MTAKEVGKIQDIQFLRGIAVLLVFTHHIPGKLPHLEVFDWIHRHFDVQVGVDIFFAISGYVITLSLVGLLSAAGATRLDLPLWRTFWKRRIARLTPSALFWAGLSVALLPLITSSEGQMFATLASIPFALLNVYNMYFTVCFDGGLIGNICPSYTATHVYWSLSLEMQFYLAFSVALMVLSLVRLAVIAGALAALSIIVFGDPVHLNGILKFLYGSFHRGYALIIGILIAVFFDVQIRNVMARIPRKHVAISILVGILIVAAAPRFLPYHIGNLVVASISGIILMLSLRGDAVSSRSPGRWICWIGERSYSFYLSHTLAIYAVGAVANYLDVTSESSTALKTSVVALALLASLGLASIGYRSIESRSFGLR